MIERYAIVSDSNHVIEKYKLHAENVLETSYNAFPTKLLPVLTNENRDGLSYFYWGQTPEWSNHKKLSPKFFNVPKHEVFKKTSYRNTALKTRCIIPMSGFYLWRKVGKKTSVPYYYRSESNDLFSIAGIWEESSDIHENVYRIFNMITSQSDDQAGIETPLILTKAGQIDWLSNDSDEQKLNEVIMENSNISLVSHTVSPLIARTDIDNQALITHQPPSDQHGNYTLFG